MSLSISMLKKRLRPLGYDLGNYNDVYGIISINKENKVFMPFNQAKYMTVQQILLHLKKLESQTSTIPSEGKVVNYMDRSKVPDLYKLLEQNFKDMRDDKIYILRYDSEKKEFSMQAKSIDITYFKNENLIVDYFANKFFNDRYTKDICIYLKVDDIVYVDCAMEMEYFDNLQQMEIAQTYIETLFKIPALDIKEVRFIAKDRQNDKVAEGLLAYTTMIKSLYLDKYSYWKSSTLTETLLKSVSANTDEDTIYYGYLNGLKEFQQSSVKVDVDKSDKSVRQIRALFNRQKNLLYTHYIDKDALHIYFNTMYKRSPTVAEEEYLDKLISQIEQLQSTQPSTQLPYSKVLIQVLTEDVLIDYREYPLHSNQLNQQTNEESSKVE